MTPRDDLRALAEARDGIIEDLVRLGAFKADSNAAENFRVIVDNRLRALAAAQEPPHRCHWCKHERANHVNGGGSCIVQHCPCVQFCVTEVAQQTPQEPASVNLQTDMPRILELMAEFNVPDTDSLKHRLEDQERWNRDILRGKLMERPEGKVRGSLPDNEEGRPADQVVLPVGTPHEPSPVAHETPAPRRTP